MKRCAACERQFPSHLIQVMVTSKGSASVCPLCALTLRNRMHGLPKGTPFHGHIAAQMWQEADDFVKGVSK